MFNKLYAPEFTDILKSKVRFYRYVRKRRVRKNEVNTNRQSLLTIRLTICLCLTDVNLYNYIRLPHINLA
jgi:hypothetical protein